MQAFEARKVPRKQSLRLGLLAALAHRPLWVAGTALNVVAFLVQVLALALASLAVVQPTLAAGLIVLAVIAWWKLGEPIHRRTVGGIAFIIAGLVCLAFLAPRHDHLPKTGAAAAGLGASFVAIVGLLAAMRVFDRSEGMPASVAAGLAYAWLSFSGALIGESFREHSWAVAGLWSIATFAAAVLALAAEMTALQSWPLTRSKPVVYVVQTLVPSLVAPFFSASGFGPAHGVPFALSLVVVSAGAALVASSASVARVEASP